MVLVIVQNAELVIRNIGSKSFSIQFKDYFIKKNIFASSEYFFGIFSDLFISD